MDCRNYAVWRRSLFSIVAVICGHTLACAEEPLNVRLVADALVLTRSDVADHPILYDAPWPLGNPLLDASELDLEEIWAGRFEANIHDLMHFGYLQTESAVAYETRSSSPADVLFFHAVDASPSPTYTARYKSQFWNADVSLANRIHRNVAVWGGVGFGELEESFDLLSSLHPNVIGFFSETKNEMVGIHLGSDITICSNGFGRIEGSVNGGIYHNDIEVFAESLNVSQRWSQDETTFIGGANVTWVIPFWPVNFRIGYQALLLSGVALAPDQSKALDLFSSSGTADTDDVVYHGALFGIEFKR